MKKYLFRLLHPTHVKRYLFFILSDIIFLMLSLYLSFLLRFDFKVTYEYELLPFAMPLFVIVKLIAFSIFRLYKITWSYVGLHELCNAVYAIIVSEAVLMPLILVPLPDFLHLDHMGFPLKGFPRSIFLIDGLITLILISGLRVSKRLFLELIRSKHIMGDKKPTLIVGAGNTGSQMVRHMEEQGFSEFYPVGFLDDDTGKIGTYIHGIKVLGTIDELKDLVEHYNVEAVIISIPSLNFKVLRKIYDMAKKSGVDTIKIIPKIYSTHKPDVNLKKLEDIRIEDLIGRHEIDTDHVEIEKLLKDNVILITGAGGSIGAELTIQSCSFSPKKVILFDNDETWLHNMELNIRNLFPDLKDVFFVTGDIRDEQRVEEVFETFSPEIVFHAAAYKHVPMMETNPKEAVKVNILGTYCLAKASADHGVRKFVLISTDKAVSPTSVMGATKRMAENICTALNDSCGTDFIAVRFGNVLGSRGSVLHLFLAQLKRGGPITVTHKDMERYFMTIPEAVSLVLQASVIGKGGEVLVLDMGAPVKIVEIAEELIKIHGLEPYKDIDIEFIGIREGEKMFEEILSAEEGTVATRHNKVFVANNPGKYKWDDLSAILTEFKAVIQNSSFFDEKSIKDLLKKHVKYYHET